MPDFASRLRLPSRLTVYRTITISIIVVAVIAAVLAGYVYWAAVRTFEVRRVSLPTRIYADAFPLRPGRYVTRGALVDKLERLGYRAATPPAKPGEYSADGGEFDISLRGYKHPTGDVEPLRIHVTLAESAITKVTDDSGNPVETAAVEPELLTSILSDQLENRRPVTLDQVPQHLSDAVVVIEDVRFWQHPGVDPIGISRALFRNVRAGGVAEGGSTLTQQLVKNYYLTNERTLRRKVVEAFMSVILDAKYSKREILEAYLNDIYLGRDRSISILGVGEAARFYFGKPISEIDIAEAALIAGMIRSPNNYSPFEHSERALARRNTVLRQMLKNEKITQSQFDVAIVKKLPRKPYRERTGLASIPFYVDVVVREIARDYGVKDVKGRGLSIYTAIDLEAQDSASTRLTNGIAALEKSSRRLRRKEVPLQGAVIIVDVPTGEIRALVGGRNYQNSQFNRAINAKRQVGSLFKPFVFLAAFEPSLSHQNITPATLVSDTRFVVERRYGRDWSPRNYGGQYFGTVTARRALEMSLNAASVRIGLATGIEPVIRTARVLGVESELEAVPSIMLGSVGVPPIQMAEAYTTIARIGSRVPLRTIRYVADDDGKLVGSGVDVDGVQVFPARAAYLGVRLMEGVVDRGTAASARRFGFRKTAAGKTGTTNDKRDAWFIGFTPSTLALTWLGFDDNSPVGLSGSDGAVPIWARIMSDVTEGEPDRDFPAPAGIVFVPVDITSGGLATPNCPSKLIVTEAFKDGTEPRGECTIHRVMPLPITPFDPSFFPGGYPTTTDPTMTDTTGTIERPPPVLEGGFPERTETAP
ncbi:MAG: PBP1A family penicillin-binding protein, partial [Thermoanaerobaculia bacterium]